MSESPTNPTHVHDPQYAAKVRPEDMDWDARYRSADQVWSGHVNSSLATEVIDRQPSLAFDVGCGEGADAIWLAENGWTVTALDVAPTAIERGRAEATRRGLHIEWLAADLLANPVQREFDLVSLQYLSFPIARTVELTRVLTSVLAPGGLLLVVGHAPPADPSAIPFDPADWVQPGDVIAALPTGFDVELHEVRPRPGDHHLHAGSPHVEDVVVRIVRR
ncbi:MAG: class I SAM-dependent methyltransferase [Actinomycetota bacterium]